jgi:23S rRNA (guanosine2251-2'-O)-methyltransferase
MKNEIIYGRQPVRELLRANRRTLNGLSLLQTRKPTPELTEIEGLARKMGIHINFVSRQQLDQATDSRNHQGVMVDASAYPTVDFDDLVASAKKEGNSAFILILDHLEDPQNLGSLLRTAEAIGVSGVVIPSDRAASVTPSAVRASAGATEWIDVAVVTNLVRSMQTLQKEGFWLTGLEAMPEAQNPAKIDLCGPVGLVVGGEGKGMGRLVRETCDFLMKLPMVGNVTSYNASVAGAMAMYEVVRQRG